MTNSTTLLTNGGAPIVVVPNDDTLPTNTSQATVLNGAKNTAGGSTDVVAVRDAGEPAITLPAASAGAERYGAMSVKPKAWIHLPESTISYDKDPMGEFNKFVHQRIKVGGEFFPGVWLENPGDWVPEDKGAVAGQISVQERAGVRVAILTGVSDQTHLQPWFDGANFQPAKGGSPVSVADHPQLAGMFKIVWDADRVYDANFQGGTFNAFQAYADILAPADSDRAKIKIDGDGKLIGTDSNQPLFKLDEKTYTDGADLFVFGPGTPSPATLIGIGEDFRDQYSQKDNHV
jgi:hypothetical protein